MQRLVNVELRFDMICRCWRHASVVKMDLYSFAVLSPQNWRGSIWEVLQMEFNARPTEKVLRLGRDGPDPTLE